MANLRDILSLNEFDKASKERLQTLERLESDVESHTAAVEDRRELEDRLLELERKYGQLEGERESLRGEFSESTFNNNFREIERIHSERERIDNELAETFTSIEETRSYLADKPLPVEGMAKTIAIAGTLSVPSVVALARKIEAIQSAQSVELHQRQQAIYNQLRDYVGEADLHSAKLEVSEEYRRKQAQQERDKANGTELERELEAYNALGGIGKLRRDPPRIDMYGFIKNSVLTDEQVRDVTKESRETANPEG